MATNHDPESSFNKPNELNEAQQKAAQAEINRFQRRRPVLFHALIFGMILLLFTFPIIFPFAFFALPIFGIIYKFRILEDGYNDDPKKPSYRLSTKFGGGHNDGGKSYFREFKDVLVSLWWGKTWAFYFMLFVTPIVVFIHLWCMGICLLRDFFFLSCWDNWIEAIESKKPKTNTFIRGSSITDLPITNGSGPVPWARNKAQKVIDRVVKVPVPESS
ncbi:MAG: hypothetical protein AAF591_20685 [Verrucomicrobiota bacterium]